jgi:hypothetical protein
MKRAGGDALVLRTGESPHVLTGAGRQNVARAVLSANALEALVTQIFSEAGRLALRDSGHVIEEVTVTGGLVLSASAERMPDHVTIELTGACIGWQRWTAAFNLRRRSVLRSATSRAAS